MKCINIKTEQIKTGGEIYSNLEFFIQQILQILFVKILPIIGVVSIDTNPTNGMKCEVHVAFFS